MESQCTAAERLLTAAGKICRKLHMGSPALALAPLCKGDAGMTSFQAQTVLNALSPEPAGEAIVDRDGGWNSGKRYDLQIIVPAYNVENYIEACVDSLLAQRSTFHWQAILINDGSTDGTRDILGKYAGHPRLEIVHQENRGFSGARNRGLDMVSSRYLMFVDADDRLEPGAIESLMSYAEENDLEVVEGNYNDWKGGKVKQASFSGRGLVSDPIHSLRGFPWGKVIRTEFFRDIQFPAGYWYEDSIFSFLIYPRCGSCGTIEDVVYSYRKNPNGISMKAKGKAKCVDTWYIARRMVEAAVSMNIDPDRIYELLLGHILLSYRRISALGAEARKAVFVKFCDLHEAYFGGSGTDDPVLKKIREAIITRDFGLFELYCRVL